MEKNTKLLIGALILIILAILLKGQLTGNVVYCSEIPEITSIKQVGDTLSLNWEDTSSFLGHPKYYIYLYKQKEDGTYNFSNIYNDDITDDDFIAITDMDSGIYTIKLKAKNNNKCATDYSEFAVSRDFKVDLSNAGMPQY